MFFSFAAKSLICSHKLDLLQVSAYLAANHWHTLWFALQSAQKRKGLRKKYPVYPRQKGREWINTQLPSKTPRIPSLLPLKSLDNEHLNKLPFQFSTSSLFKISFFSDALIEFREDWVSLSSCPAKSMTWPSFAEEFRPYKKWPESKVNRADFSSSLFSFRSY